MEIFIVAWIYSLCHWKKQALMMESGKQSPAYQNAEAVSR